MVYVVTINTDEYEFKDGMTALSFSELALKHFTPGEYSKEISVMLTLREKGGDK